VIENAPHCIFHSMRPGDVRLIVCSPNGMIASDSGVAVPGPGVVHPRYYGTFPRVLREYVRERRLLSLQEAVRKMTSLPARKFGLEGRGMVAPGAWADLVLFDPERVADRATYEAPRQHPEGIAYVLVNGAVAWDGRRQSRARTGQVIRKP
jgi:N-acyl-D-amino-acid deacylase